MDGRRCINRSSFPIDDPPADDVELSLGLSLNGRFSLNPTRKRLRRSSSVSDLLPRVIAYDNGVSYRTLGAPLPRDVAPLARASSLPAETEEVQGPQARRRRMEKIRNVRGPRAREGHNQDEIGDDGGIGNEIESPNPVAPPLRFEGLAGNGIDGMQLLPVNASSSVHVPTVQAPGQGTNALLDMPFVSTRGQGPSHASIQGFLYKYNRHDNIKIVCVCHGLFLSPSEFLKHGGGSDAAAAEPLKHIVVLPFPFP